MVLKKRNSLSLADLCLIALMTGLTAVSGFIKIPFFPVPITLQTLFVYLSGSLLGKKGGISQLLFLGLGLAGLPIFTHGGGPGYVLQPTFGYLLAFPITAVVIGLILEKEKKQIALIHLMMVNFMGMIIIFGLGCIGLFIHFNYVIGQPMSLPRILWIGAGLLVPGELIKIAIASLITDRLQIGMSLSKNS